MPKPTDDEVLYDPARYEVRAGNFRITDAGQHIRDKLYLHIYFYQDDQSKFYFVVERLKIVGQDERVIDTGICDVQYIGYNRDNEPGYLRRKDISEEQKRIALLNIQRGMQQMEIPTYGRSREVRISAV